ncbi:hypothetical protein SRHO_G00083040 [Serrasalmus rhombeus]
MNGGIELLIIPHIHLQEELKEREDGCEHDEDTLYLDSAPSIQFRYSCAPNYIQCLTTFTGCSGRTVVGFQWGHKMDHRQIKVWTQNKRGKLAHYKSVPMENNYKVDHLVFIPSQRVFVGSCSDLSLRVFSNPGQGMVLQYQAVLLSSVLCMHYCKDTEELLTGGMGIITFWGFWTSLDVQLGIVRVLDWNCCSLRSDSTISALVTEQQSSILYALCDRRIKSFHVKYKKELRSFHGHGQGSLRCVSSDWVQRYLYTGDISGCVQVWSQDSRSLLQEFHAHSRCVSAMVLRPNTQTLLTSSQDGWVKEWSCCGELLAKLFLDDPGGVRSMWLINEHQILCHSLSSFYVWQLQSIYKPFYSSGRGLQYLQRVECGPDRARILAMSQDSIVQIISPVSGEMLLLAWPFPLLERALAFAYDPGQDNLFVAFGTPEVLVLDTSLCPCPAKRILCVSKNHDQDESVMSLEVVMMAGASNTPPPCLVFSGHRNGKLQLLSAPPRFHCQARKAHGGTVLQISSLPGPKAQLCCYGEDEQLTVWSVEVGVEQVELALIIRISPHSRLMLTKLMQGLIFAVSPGYSLLLYSLVDGKGLAMERNPPTAITCMDYCAALGLVAVSGPAGIVEVWDTRGLQLAEIQLSAPVGQVCFANARGDLLACFSGSISIIAGVRYLPVSLLKQVLAQAPGDDLLEDPVPFLPCSSSCYDLGLVPRFLLKPGEAAPEKEIAHSPSTVQTIPEPDLDTCRGSSERTSITPKTEQRGSQYFTSPADKKLSKQEEEIITMEKTEPESLDRGQVEISQQQLDVEPVTLGWPVAPDGFIPNSVIRNWGQNQEQQVPEKPTEAKAPQGVSTDKHLHKRVKVIKVRAQRISKPVTVKELSGNEFFIEPELEEEDIFKRGSFEDLLKKIAQSQWLAKKPKTDELESVMQAVMLSMDCMDPRVYISCAEALYSLREAYGIPPEIKKQLTHNLIRDVQKGNPNWKRLDALKTLLQLDLLLEEDLFAVAEALTDEGQDLRQLARDAVAQVFSINTKETLLARLHHIEEGPTRQKLLQYLDTQLSEDLQLQQSFSAESPKPIKRRTRPYRQRVSTTGNEADSPQYDIMSDDRRERICASVFERHHPSQPAQPPDDVRSISPPAKFVKPPHCAKKYREFSVSHPVREMITLMPSSTEGLVDPVIMTLYKKFRAQSLAYSPVIPLHPPPSTLLPSDSGVFSDSRRSSSLVQLPPVARPELLHLEPAKGKGDPNWRESLHQLTSIYGFRSQKASKLANQVKVHKPEPRPDCVSFKFPPIHSCLLSLGQRVVEKLQIKETAASEFHYVMPLPWQLNIHTLDSAGESQYGRLNIDWRARPLDRPGVKLPPIRSKNNPHLVPQGGSVS